MLMWIGPLALIAIATFASLAAPSSRGNWGDAGAAAFIFGAIAVFLFMLVVPAISTAVDDSWDYNEKVTGKLTTIQDGDNAEYLLTRKDGSFETYDQLDLEFISTNAEVTLQEFCDVTPAWASPWTYGSCHTMVTIG